MLPCPSCGLAVERGRSPFKLAWHDCAEVVALRRKSEPVTPDSIEQAVLEAIGRRLQTEDLPLRELAQVLELIRGERTGPAADGPGLSQQMKELLADARS